MDEREQPSSPSKSGTRLFAFIAVIFALVIVGLIGVMRRPHDGASSSSDSEPQLEHVRIGYQPIMGGAGLPLFTALDQGFFKKRGLDVELVRFESSPGLAAATVHGDLDVVASFAYAVALTTESRDPGKLKVFLVDECTPTGNLSAMVALPKSGITKVEDLRGKRVGSYPGPTALTFFGLVMQKHGLDPKKDVTIVELPAGTQLQALASGQVDALNTYEPMATQAVLDYGAVKYYQGSVETEIINPWQAGVCALPTKFLNERPEVAKKVIQAMYEALDFTRTNPDEAKKALPKFTAIEPRVADAVPIMPVKKILEIDRTAFQHHADILTEAKLLDKKMDAEQLLIDTAFLPAH